MAESSPLAHSPTLVSGAADAPDGERLAPGTHVGEYVIDRFLGAGAMGEVYAGKQPVIGKRVAIKVLKREVGASTDGAERFKREARAVNQIDHPNVIDIFSFGRLDDGRLYLVMDLVEGRSLRKAISDGPLDVPAALAILAQIADALDAAHARGVVHRDLKPDNVMIGSSDKVFVLDFGLAKLLAPGEGVAPASMLTGQGTWLGTPGYMAPEQWSAEGAGPASDRYALGVMAFELLSGKLPFQAQSLPQMMEQHFRAKVPALSTRGAIATSSRFDPVVSRAMAKDPLARYATAREMVEALRTVAGGLGARATSGRSKRPWLPAAVGLGVLGLSVGAVLLVRGDKDRRATEPEAAAAPAAGMSRVQIESEPSGAGVYRNDRLVGQTPTQLDLPPGTKIAFELRKPGYASARHSMTMPGTETTLPVFTLAPLDGYQGVWQLPNKELRAFKRTGERVEASKLDSVNGPRQFFRHYDLLPSDGGVAFGSTEELVDQRAPSDPSCHISHKVEYQYDPPTDALVLRRERLSVDFKEGHCVILSKELGDAEALTRVDRGTTDARETLPPVGRPDFAQQDNVNVPNDSLDNSLDKGQKDSVMQKTVPVDQKQLDAIDAKQQQKVAPKKPLGPNLKVPKKKSPPPAKQSLKSDALDPAIDKQIGQAVSPNNAPSQANSAAQPPQKPPANQAAANQAKPRGDSQVAPQFQPQQQAPQQQAITPNPAK